MTTQVGSRSFGGTIAVLAGLAAVGALSTNIILPAFPAMARDLGVPTRDMGLTLSSFFIAFALGQIIVGPLSDRLGRRLPVLAGLAIFALGSVIAALADNFPMLILGRVVQALGVCATSVLSRAIARDLYDGQALARLLSLTMVAMAAAPGFSPLLGSLAYETLGWRAIFILVALLAGLLALGYAMGMGETLPVHRRQRTSLRAVLGGYASLLGDGRFLFPAISVSMVLGGLYAFFGAAPAVLMGTMRLSSLELGFFFAGTVFVVFFAGLAAPRLAAWAGGRRVAVLGSGIAIAGAAGLAWTGASGSFPSFTLAVAVFLLGMGLVSPLGTAMALQPFGARAGLASALLGFLQMLCAAIGTALVAILDLPAAEALGLVMTLGSILALAALMVASRAMLPAIEQETEHVR